VRIRINLLEEHPLEFHRYLLKGCLWNYVIWFILI